jgi:hypothetical protein
MDLGVDAGGVAAMSQVAAGHITSLGDTAIKLQDALNSGHLALASAPRAAIEWGTVVAPWVSAALAIAEFADDIVVTAQRGVTALITADDELAYQFTAPSITIFRDAG